MSNAQTALSASAALSYYTSVTSVLERIAVSQMSSMCEAATLVANAIERGRVIYSLGSGHSLLVAAELYYRAGGLANFDVIHDRTFGRAERLSGYAHVLLDSYPVSADDLLIIVSNSGRNALPVEMAVEARDRGMRTIGITSMAHSRSVESRLRSGRRLFEVCDVVIDNCGVPGDATVEFEGGYHTGPTSTLAGVFIANCISTLATAALIERGIQPPVFMSANLEGGDAHNARLLSFMRDHIRGL